MEYQGEYGARYTCSWCSHFKDGICSKIGDQLTVNSQNNICPKYEARIKNPSSPTFNFDQYFEFLMNDYYRPWTIDKKQIIGSAKFNEVVMDNGWLAATTDVYVPFYQSYDLPRCTLHVPRPVVKKGLHTFYINYTKWRKETWLQGDQIYYDSHVWKDNKGQRKAKSEHYGVFNLREMTE